MLPEKFLEVLRYEGVVAIATQGSDGLHLVNTWNSYIQISGDGHLLIPAGRMNRTEKNVTENNRVLLTLGTREVTGLRGGPGAGFLINGHASFEATGSDFDAVKNKFPWARAALRVAVANITQTL